MDNSPHVPFFLPIIRELKSRGYELLLTGRDSYQVCELVKFHGLSCKFIGKHYGKNHLLKFWGTILRTLQLVSWAVRKRPGFALSHGSRSQVAAASILEIPTAVAFDYEFISAFTKIPTLAKRWVIVPEMIPDSALDYEPNRIVRYPGLKENVYVSDLRPDPTILTLLGISEDETVVTMRPPAIEAHYHNPESDSLFNACMRYLVQEPNVRVVLLPRNKRQEAQLRQEWPQAITERKVIIPERVMNGLNLIWFSDLVISGGGTMNREAAALGVPVYSIFRGQIGAVDRYLAKCGVLVLLGSVAEIPRKVALVRRKKPVLAALPAGATLETIVGGIVSMLESIDSPKGSFPKG